MRMSQQLPGAGELQARGWVRWGLGGGSSMTFTLRCHLLVWLMGTGHLAGGLPALSSLHEPSLGSKEFGDPVFAGKAQTVL